MIIGINAAAAIKQPRTGVEEYTHQLIKHLTMLPEAREHRFLLYLPSEALAKEGVPIFDFSLPPNFEIKTLRWPLPFLWTQIRLAWEMLVRSPEALFIPVHVLPFFAPKKSIVTVHGLEYEYWPQNYSFWRRLYLRWSTKFAVGRARKIIAISENTKNDLIKLYGENAEKINVVYHGASPLNVIPAKAGIHPAIAGRITAPATPEQTHACDGGWECGMTIVEKPYLLYVGRIETKKNVQGILESYKILKEKYNIPHKLVLAGASGYGYKNLKFKIDNLLKIENCKLKIKELGYINEETKWRLLSNADIFLFPSFYEGFGLPILEAQAAGAPVVTSLGSCLPEIAGKGALFVNPQNSVQIAEAVKRLIDDNVLRDKLIQLGHENVKRFNWDKCARETLKIVVSD